MPLARRLSDIAARAGLRRGARATASAPRSSARTARTPTPSARTLGVRRLLPGPVLRRQRPALSTEDSRARCARIQHALAAGFTQALRERTLAEQEAISRPR